MPSHRRVCLLSIALLVALLVGCGSDSGLQIAAPGSSTSDGEDTGGAGAPAPDGAIGPSGGTVSTGDGTRVVVPAGALSQAQTITIADADAPPAMTAHSAAGDVKALGPEGVTFEKPVELRLPYDATGATGFVRIVTYDTESASWVEVSGSSGTAGMATAQVMHFSLYAAAVRDDGDGDGGRIVGHVTHDGKGLHEAQVKILSGPSKEGESVKTGEAGGYELEGLTAGIYKLQASCEGYDSQIAEGIEVTAGESTRKDFELGAKAGETGAIAGRVWDGDGQAIVEAKVEVIAGPGDTIGRHRYTNEKGVYELAELPIGKYALKASREGYTSKTEDGIEVVAGKVTEEHFTLTADMGRIAGRVRDSKDSPIAEAKVEVVAGPGDTKGKSVYTNADGIYELENLPAGAYALKASRDGHGEKTEDGIVVVAGKTTEQHFTLGGGDDTGRVVGRVRDANEKRIANAKVEVLEGPGDTKGKSVLSNDDGIYELEGLPAGTYALKASKEGYAAKTEDGVNIEAGKTTELLFTLG